MVLEKFVFTIGEGVQVELKPELLVPYSPKVNLFLPYVPTKLLYNNIVKERYLNFNVTDANFSNDLDDFFPDYEGGDRIYDVRKSREMAQIYSNLLHGGFIKIREGEFKEFCKIIDGKWISNGKKEWYEYDVFPNLESYRFRKESHPCFIDAS